MKKLATLIAATILITTAGISTGHTSEQRTTTGSLTVTPQAYIAGQGLTWEGQMPKHTKQNIWLQFNMNRNGDAWTDVVGSNKTTDSQGNYSFTYPAPAMIGISYRVKSADGTVSEPFYSTAKWQDLTLSTNTPATNYTQQPNYNLLKPLPQTWTAVAGKSYTLTIDTTPTQGRSGALTPPATPGRNLLIQQQQNTGAWKTLTTVPIDRDGTVSVQLTAPVGVKEQTLRVVQDAWRSNGGYTGQYPSYPHRLVVIGPGENIPQNATWTRPDRLETTATPGAGASPLAASRYNWWPRIYDFAWEYGQSTENKPSFGTRMKGSWKTQTNGTGRTVVRNGALTVDSGYDNTPGKGSWGTTSAHIVGNTAAYGRWEMRIQTRQIEQSINHYTVLAELIPADGSKYDCGKHNITLGKITPTRSGLGIGARNGEHKWSLDKSINLGDEHNNLAVEVTPNHITWYLNSQMLGSVKSTKAVSGLKLTPRIRLLGQGQTRLSQTQVNIDWVRAFPTTTGQSSTTGQGLKHTTTVQCGE